MSSVNPTMHRGLSLLTLVLCVTTFGLYLAHIDGTLPYPSHVDEEAIVGPARNILVTGDFHPQEFNYPSLPRYIAAVGLAVGFIRSAPSEGVTDIRQIGSVSYPHYGIPTAVETVKQLFALLSVIAFAATAFASWRLTNQPKAAAIGLLFLLSSQLYFGLSWQYLNVDIVGTCFVMLAVASCLGATSQQSVVRSAVIPSLWAGLAAASKYTLGLVLLPVLLSIWLYQTGDRRIRSIGIAILTAGLAFLVSVPYALLDLPSFLNGLAFDAWHYGTGHRGFENDAGLPQLAFYASHFTHEFGLIGIGLVIVGTAAAIRDDWRRAIVFLTFPVLLLTLLAGQRVHFPRNVLPLHPLFAIAAGYGFVICCTFFTHWLSKLYPRFEGTPAKTVIVVLLLALVLPGARLKSHATVTPDSRNLARVWLAENIPADWKILLTSELNFDQRGLANGHIQVEEVSVSTLHDQNQLLASVEGQVVALVPIWGVDGRFDSAISPDEINAMLSGKRVLAAFGSNEVLLNYDRGMGTVWGDPKFVVISP